MAPDNDSLGRAPQRPDLVGDGEAGGGEEGGDVEFGREQAGQLQETGYIVDIAVDALRDSRILHLDREQPTVRRECAGRAACDRQSPNTPTW